MPGSDGRAARRRVRAGDEGVGAVVDVEQGALRTLEEHGLARLERLVEQQPGVGDPVGEAAAVGEDGVDHLVHVERAPVVDLDQHLVLQLQGRLDLLVQDLLVQDVGHPHPHPGDLVLVGRADAAAGGADLRLAQEPLADLVHGDVVRHDQVRVGGDHQPGGVHTPPLQAGQLVEQHAGIHDHAVADHVVGARGEDAGRDQVQGEVLAVGQHHRVARVVAALVAHHPLDLAPEQVGRLALALVAPLGADHHDRRHVKLQLPGRGSHTEAPLGTAAGG